jgi:hypothetical protein
VARCSIDWHARTPKDACLRPWARLLFPRTSWEERRPIIRHSPATPFHPTAALAYTLAGRPWASGLADRWTDQTWSWAWSSIHSDQTVSDTPFRYRQAPGTSSHPRVTRFLPCARRAPANLSHHCEPACDPTSSLPAPTPTPTYTTTKMMDTSRGSFYDNDVPSLSASLEAFDPERSTSMQHSAYSARSNMHSSRWSIPQEEPESEAESDGPWAPPAWQKSNNQWLRKSHLGEGAMRSSRSPFERDITPSRIPLPESPLKQTPRTSPEPMTEQEQSYMPANIASRMQSPSEELPAGMSAQLGDDMALSHHDAEDAHDGCRYI